MEAETKRRAALLAAVSALGMSLGVTVPSRADESPKENRYATPGGDHPRTESRQLKVNSQQLKGESQQLKIDTQHIKGQSQQLKGGSQQLKGESQQLKIDGR